MSNRYIQFLVAPTGSSPEDLLRSIKEVGDSSISFCTSWNSGHINDAGTISQNAFKFLNHIQNELIRHRDKKLKESKSSYNNSGFKTALEQKIGLLIDPVNSSQKTAYMNLTEGSGALPIGATFKDLLLVTALNKLKHYAIGGVNFTIDAEGNHILFFFTDSGQGHKETISRFNVQIFCEACRQAVEAINT